MNINYDKKQLDALKAYVNVYFEDNIFFKQQPILFFDLWLLLKDNKDTWENKLLFKNQYSNILSWLNTLFNNNNPAPGIFLNTADVVKLVLNGISKLPNDCKCHLKSLNATVDI